MTRSPRRSGADMESGRVPLNARARVRCGSQELRRRPTEFLGPTGVDHPPLRVRWSSLSAPVRAISIDAFSVAFRVLSAAFADRVKTQGHHRRLCMQAARTTRARAAAPGRSIGVEQVVSSAKLPERECARAREQPGPITRSLRHSRGARLRRAELSHQRAEIAATLSLMGEGAVAAFQVHGSLAALQVEAVAAPGLEAGTDAPAGVGARSVSTAALQLFLA